MDNPIGRKKREELGKIKLEAEQANVILNTMSTKLEELELFITRFNSFEEKFQIIFEFMVEENTEPTAEDIQKMQEMEKEVQEQMKVTIQNALLDLVNKPENQKAIMEFANQFSQGVQGKGQLAGMVDADGNPNWFGMAEKFLSGRNMGVPPQGAPAPAQRKSKSTGY